MTQADSHKPENVKFESEMLLASRLKDSKWHQHLSPYKCFLYYSLNNCFKLIRKLNVPVGTPRNEEALERLKLVYGPETITRKVTSYG